MFLSIQVTVEVEGWTTRAIDKYFCRFEKDSVQSKDCEG